MEKNKLSIFFLRTGIAFAFFYAATASFLNPTAWFGFFPEFIRNLLPGNLMLTIFSIGEISLGLWLFLNYRIFYAAVISAFVMAGIIIFNFGAMDIVFRDVTIFFAAIALAVLTKKK